MRKTLTILVVIAGLLWQAAAFAQDCSGIDAAIHAASHVGVAHHHGDDGSPQFDNSDASLQHMQADHCTASAGLVSRAPSVLDPNLRHGVGRAFSLHPPSGPFLEGPHRPPRSRS